MNIHMTLEEVLDRCSDWDYFCEKEGYSVWAVNEGGGDVTVYLSEESCIEYGILKK